jgi:hypothetical protein
MTIMRDCPLALGRLIVYTPTDVSSTYIPYIYIRRAILYDMPGRNDSVFGLIFYYLVVIM